MASPTLERDQTSCVVSNQYGRVDMMIKPRWPFLSYRYTFPWILLNKTHPIPICPSISRIPNPAHTKVLRSQRSRCIPNSIDPVKDGRRHFPIGPRRQLAGRNEGRPGRHSQLLRRSTQMGQDFARTTQRNVIHRRRTTGRMQETIQVEQRRGSIRVRLQQAHLPSADRDGVRMAGRLPCLYAKFQVTCTSTYVLPQ